MKGHIVCDAVRFFCDATRFFCDAVRFFRDAARHQLYLKHCKEND
jgi:hypothetical protein